MSELITITLIIILAAISPGPDFAMVVKNSLQHDRRSGILTALGVSVSLIIHASYCVIGLAIVISKSLLLFSIIKYLGAAYLIYIGTNSLLSKQNMSSNEHHKSHSSSNTHNAFLQGLLCNLLNPKAIMFILAFFTMLVSSTSSIEILIEYIIEISLIHFVWFTFLALMITHPRIKKNLAKVQVYIIKAMGFLLIAFGARIAFVSQLVT